MTAIKTAPTREVPTHIVSYWQRRERVIVAVEALDDEDAVRKAVEKAGEADPSFEPTRYNVAQLR